LKRFRSGNSVEAIAESRGLAISTIFGHIAEAVAAGEKIDLGRFLKQEERAEIEVSFSQLGLEALSPVFQALGGRYDYGRLRLVRAALTAKRAA
jgi:ATP-dependent DNA helicase RecQ